MFIAYILTKQRQLKLKIIRSASEKVFTYADFEYEIDMEKVYSKKFLGIKVFFFSLYIQDNPKPLKFIQAGIDYSEQDIPINELAYFASLLKKGKLTKIAEIMSIAGGIIGIILIIYIFRLQNQINNMEQYTHLMGEYIDKIFNIVNVP